MFSKQVGWRKCNYDHLKIDGSTDLSRKKPLLIHKRSHRSSRNFLKSFLFYLQLYLNGCQRLVVFKWFENPKCHFLLLIKFCSKSCQLGDFHLDKILPKELPFGFTWRTVAFDVRNSIIFFMDCVPFDGHHFFGGLGLRRVAVGRCHSADSRGSKQKVNCQIQFKNWTFVGTSFCFSLST